ncbi:hypothetical protein EZS27_016107 [termite gut metagenome]|uniref:Uncharacterized protein n=1 Tax=termite gut metagenome TaxID=433724 RepID=A0A5J4RP19_9ZZZZ
MCYLLPPCRIVTITISFLCQRIIYHNRRTVSLRIQYSCYSTYRIRYGFNKFGWENRFIIPRKNIYGGDASSSHIIMKLMPQETLPRCS